MPFLETSAWARRYLAPFVSSPWRWDDEGEVIVWRDGPTIAFRGEVQEVLARLAPHGLPPFHAVVLLLAACRDGWPSESSRLSAGTGLTATLERREFPEWFGHLFLQLDAVHALPADLRTTPGAKADLAEMVFEGCRGRTVPEETKAVTLAVASQLAPELLTPRSELPTDRDDTLRHLRHLHEGLGKLDAERLRLRRRTGLDQLVRAADVELPPADTARRLIARLHDDPELGGVARIARHLLAALHLPRSLADHEDLPVGGVSDISNRGPLDRLLLSELAHDDLTLAVRVALNEALYLRREAPPRCPPRQRAVLIDAGIRLWGAPRVFATAVALSLAATTDRKIRVEAFRACGQAVERVTLTHREGLLAHLEALQPDVHPGEALPAFAAALPRHSELTDAVVVTGEETAADRTFQQALAALDVPLLWLATVSREGRFRLLSCHARHTRVLREARLDLERLLEPPASTVTPLLDAARAEFPAILRQQPFPLLVSHPPIDYSRTWSVPGNGVLSLGRNRSLLHWDRPRRGARLLADNVPAGQVHWVGSGADDAISLAVVGDLQHGQISVLQVDVNSGEWQSTPLDLGEGRPRSVCGHGGAVMVLYHDCLKVFSPQLGGSPLQVVKQPRDGFQQICGRFFRGWKGWCAVSHDGRTVRIEPLGAPTAQLASRQLVAVVDSADGPIAMTTDGHLYDVAHDRAIHVAHGLLGVPRVAAIARDGSRIVIAPSDHGARMSLIDVPSGTCRRVSGNAMAHAEPEIVRYTTGARDVGRRFRAVCIDENENLVIERSKGTRVSVQMDRYGRECVLSSQHSVESAARYRVEFESIASPDNTGYVLHSATWQDGSRAVRDSRGMMHLKSSDRTIPELTLVLYEGALTGWCADGRWFGSPYFIGDHTPTPGAVIYEEVLKPFVLRLR